MSNESVSSGSPKVAEHPIARAFNTLATVASATIPVMLAAVMTEKKDEEPIVTFGPDAKPSDVSNYSLGVLKDIMKEDQWGRTLMALG